MATIQSDRRTVPEVKPEAKKDPLATSAIPKVIDEIRRVSEDSNNRVLVNKYARGELLGKVSQQSRWLSYLS